MKLTLVCECGEPAERNELGELLCWDCQESLNFIRHHSHKNTIRSRLWWEAREEFLKQQKEETDEV